MTSGLPVSLLTSDALQKLHKGNDEKVRPKQRIREVNHHAVMNDLRCHSPGQRQVNHGQGRHGQYMDINLSKQYVKQKQHISCSIVPLRATLTHPWSLSTALGK
jgi:hypothetical protein